MKPTEEISVREVFGIDTDMKVKAFAEPTDRVRRFIMVERHPDAATERNRVRFAPRGES